MDRLCENDKAGKEISSKLTSVKEHEKLLHRLLIMIMMKMLKITRIPTGVKLVTNSD